MEEIAERYAVTVDMARFRSNKTGVSRQARRVSPPAVRLTHRPWTWQLPLSNGKSFGKFTEHWQLR